MQRATHTSLIASVVLLFATSVTLGAARIKSIELCTGVTGDGFTAVNVREAFDPDTAAIHAVVLLEDVRANSVLTGAWISIDAISVPDYKIDSAEVAFKRKGPASAHFSLSRPTNGWPVGNYRLDVSLDGQPIGSKAFSISGPAGDTAPAQPAAPAAQDAEQTRAKLAALQAAHDAGILNDQEYAAKKAALDAQMPGAPPAIDSETRKRLEALESAYKAGVVSQQEYEQKKQLLLGGEGQSQVRPTTVPAADSRPTQAPVAREGRTYSHTSGFSFWYPASWNVTEQDGMLQLVPPDAAVSPQGPLELYFLATENIAGQGIQEPADERVVKYLDEQVKSLSPSLEYTRQPSTIQTAAGKGAVLVWQATAPDGRRITARVFVTFVKETAVMLISMGLKERIDARDKDLQDLFKSITTGQVAAPSSAPASSVTPQAQESPVPAAVEQPPSTAKQAGANLDQQMKALDAAREAGVFSEQEYAAKKKELEEKRMQTLDGETAKKLEALQTAHQAGILTDEEFARKKAQLLAGSPSPAAQAGAQAPGVASAPMGGKTYRHVIGFSFWYPADWAVKELESALQLVPPNPGTANGEPTEAYFIIGDTVAGEAITRADDPRVVQYMDQAVASISGLLKRTAAPAPKSMTKGQGAVMSWEGTSPTGNLVRARAYVSIINNYGVALVGLGFKDPLEQRDAVLQRIFASFAFGAGQLDQRLCGTWTFLTTQSLTNWSPFETSYSRANMASDTTGTLVLQPDGTWSRSKRTHMIAGAGGTFVESDDTKTSKGRWNAGNGALYLIWDDNTWEDYKYEVRQTPEGVRLLLTSGRNGELWEKAP